MKPELEIVYEDNHLLVVIKPENLPVQADSSGDLDLLSQVKEDIRRRYQKPGNVYVGLVHRLDRPVGGVMVLAKTSKAAARLSEQIRKREFHKIYYAVVRGNSLPGGRLVHYLKKDCRQNQVRIASKIEEGAKEAVLDYELQDATEGMSLVKINLHTGRSHQIRVQMAAIGHPLFGDQKYGATQNRPGEQLALWAVEIQFKHPTKSEILHFHSNPPKRYPWSLFPSAFI